MPKEGGEESGGPHSSSETGYRISGNCACHQRVYTNFIKAKPCLGASGQPSHWEGWHK